MSDDATQARLDELEARVRTLEAVVQAELAAGRAAPPASSLPPPPPMRPPGPPPPQAAVPAAPPLDLDSETLLKWGGVGLVVLAVGFAVSTAISRGWIGPELQLAGALAISLTLIGTGWRLRPTRLPWTHALCAGGVAALFTTFASDLFLDQTSDDVAFVLTAVTGLAAYTLARAVPSEWVGATTLFGGTIGWLVIAGDDVPLVPTTAWMGFLVAVGVALSTGQRWIGLRLVSHLVGLGAVMGLAGEATSGADQAVVLVAAAALVASLFVVVSIGDLSSPWQEVEIQLAAVTTPWAFLVLGITFDIEGETTAGWIGLAVAVVGVLGAALVRPRIRDPHFVSLLLGASVTLSISLALLLSTLSASVVFVALTVQGAGLIILARALGDSLRVLVNAAVVLAIAAVYVFGAGVDAWRDDLPVGDDIAHLAIIIGVAVAGWLSRHDTALRAVGLAVLGLTLVWSGSVLVHLPEGQALVSVSWAVVGTAVLVTGAVR